MMVPAPVDPSQRADIPLDNALDPPATVLREPVRATLSAYSAFS